MLMYYSDGNVLLVINSLDSLCSEIIKYDNKKPAYSWSTPSFEDKKIINLDNLLTVIVKIQDTSILKKILEHVITQPIFYPIIKIVEIFLKYRNIVSAGYFENFGVLKNTLVEGIGPFSETGLLNFFFYQKVGSIFLRR